MKQKYLVLSALLAAVLLLLTLPAGAEEEVPVYQSGDYKYTLNDDGTATITGFTGYSASELAIPSELDGKTVTGIGDDAFAFLISLTSVTIPDSVTAIGVNPFRFCERLTSVQVSPDHSALAVIDDALISKTDKRLVWYPMKNDTRNYSVPQDIVIIGEYAFNLCDNLKSVTFPDSVTAIGNYAFSDCKYLTDVTIPDSVTTIGDYAFSSCDSLNTVTIPDSVKIIGANPFLDCEHLKSVEVSPDHPTLATTEGVLFSKPDNRLVWYSMTRYFEEYSVPQGIVIIGDDAFYHCNLKSVTIPDSVTAIGRNAFYYCTSLTGVTIPDSVTAIGDRAFYACERLTDITIPDSVTSIGTNPFFYCKLLQSVQVSPDHPTLATIDGVLFSKPDNRLVWYPITKNSTEYSVPQGIVIIGECVFYNCDSLISVTIPDSVTTIGDGAFDRCDSLTDITIPASVTTIGNRAFEYCKNLTSVTIPASVTSIGEYAFSDCPNLTLTVPLGSCAEQYCRENRLNYTCSDSPED